ncbi:MAG: DUF2285 domain-containing protein [Mesorhizobium sp.]|nr:MAG: DUF2285 domain-containing protein [Mesorhizobium sp.]
MSGRLVPPERVLFLRALDGARASHREIAEALIGEGRVGANGRILAIISAIEIRRAGVRGRALMNGGYRDFLV